MKTVIKSNSFFSNIIAKQSVDINSKYKVSKYLITTEVDNGYLVYNTLFGDLFFLLQDEFKFLKSGKITCDVQRELVENRLLVKYDTEENQVYSNYKDLISAFKDSSFYNTFTILTTTDCNARCYYCYQHGIEHNYMSETTALKIADYIVKNSKGTVFLRWFGGEPLYNFNVINLICDYLKSNNISFVSSIISNGLLFDDKNVSNAVEKWNLKKTQITLDGTRDVYNEIKNYINCEKSNAFDIVISNIKRLLNSDIQVNIRLNVGKNNIDDSKKLVEFIKDEFKNYDKINVYTALLYELRMQIDTDTHFSSKLIELDNMIFESGLFTKKLSSDDLKKYNCIADNPNSLLIDPIGDFYKCEHIKTENRIGDINKQDINGLIIKEFCKNDILEECNNCPLITKCNMLKLCQNHMSYCTQYKKQHELSYTIFKMKNTYYNN